MLADEFCGEEYDRKMPSLRSFAAQLGETKVTNDIKIFDLKP